MLTLFTHIFNLICQPNPSKYPLTPEDSKLFFQRNKVSLIAHFFILLFPVLLLPFATFSLPFQIIRIGVLFLMLLVFIITCRSSLKTGQVINLIFSHITTTYLIYQSEGVYYQLSVAHIAPIFHFLVTHDPYISAASATYHAVLMIIKLKQILLNAILYTDPEIFVEKFVKNFVIYFVMIEIIYIMTFTALNRRTIQLSKATKIAKDALEQQKTFLYSFSHEMRNPMNSLLGNLDLVLMNNLTVDTRNMLNTAKTCGILLLNQINTLLDAGKMDLTKLEVKPTSTKVHDLLQKIWAISCDLIAQKGLKSHLKIEKKVPALLMLDRHRLGQILLNLIGNATKFTQKGSIEVTVQWVSSENLNDECFEPIPYDEEDEGIFEKEENMFSSLMNNFYHILDEKHKEFDLQNLQEIEKETPGVLKIIIKDTGCGISSEEIPKLFGKFSQVGNDVYQKSIGTGLGLFISKEICKNMDGDIRVYSKPKVGTTFIVCIPTTALPQQPNQIQDVDNMIQALKLKKLNVIVADDSPFNVNLISNFCFKFGAQIIAATYDGRSASEKYFYSLKQGVTVDLVTLDIDMPIMDGKEACEKIRQFERENNIKPAIIMLISGNYEAQQVTNMIGDSKNRRADSFMRKPLIFTEFCCNVYKLVHHVDV